MPNRCDYLIFFPNTAINRLGDLTAGALAEVQAVVCSPAVKPWGNHLPAGHFLQPGQSLPVCVNQYPPRVFSVVALCFSSAKFPNGFGVSFSEEAAAKKRLDGKYWTNDGECTG